MLTTFRRLWRTLINSPGRIVEGPAWIRLRYHIWRQRRRGTNGYITESGRRAVFLSGRLRYDYLRVAVLPEAPTFPEVVPEPLVSPDGGLDLVFSNEGKVPESVASRVSSGNGVRCWATDSQWNFQASVGAPIRVVERRPYFDHREFNPVDRRVDTALISTYDAQSPDSDGLKKLAALRVPSTLSKSDQLAVAIRALGCGTPVVLDPASPATASLECGGVITIPEAAPLTVGRLGFDQPFAFERASAAAWRFAFWRYSSIVEADRLVADAGFLPVSMPTVSVILVTRRPELLVAALESITNQNYSRLEVVVGIHSSSVRPELVDRAGSVDNVSSVTVYEPNTPFGEVLDATINRCSGRLVAKMDDDDWYASDHISDLVAGWILSRADVVGKTSNFAYLEATNRTLGYDDELQHRRVEHIPGGTMLATKDMLVDYKFGRTTRAVDSVLLRKIRADGGFLYSTTRQGFMRRRHDGHTAGFGDDWFVRRAHGKTTPGLRLDFAGIAPVQKP